MIPFHSFSMFAWNWLIDKIDSRCKIETLACQIVGCFYVNPDKNNKEVEIMYNMQILKTFGTTFSEETSGRVWHTLKKKWRIVESSLAEMKSSKDLFTALFILGCQGQESSLIMMKFDEIRVVCWRPLLRIKVSRRQTCTDYIPHNRLTIGFRVSRMTLENGCFRITSRN